MALYYVNNRAQENGDHEVHKTGCAWMPEDRTYLGDFNNCRDAVRKAKEKYARADGCAHCSPECHTR
jgi:hypothetical protein